MGVKTGLVSLAAVLALAGTLGLNSGSAGGATSGATETLVGTAQIAGAPAGWHPSNFYLQLCPAAVKFTMSCRGQGSGSPDQGTGDFQVSVPASAWTVGMYYYTANGQIILSTGVKVSARPGATIHHDITMSYVVPAVSGTVHLTGAPRNFASLAYMGVQACPAGSAFSVGCRGGQEAYEDVNPGSSYLIDLPRGSWRVAAYYRDDNNSTSFSGVPVRFTATHGSTRHVDVTIAFQGT